MLTYHTTLRRFVESVYGHLCEYHTESTVFTVRPVRSMRAYGNPKPRLFLLCWHRRDVDPSNAEDDMKPPRSSSAFISRSIWSDRRDRTSGQIQYGQRVRPLRSRTVTSYGLYGEPDRTKFLLTSKKTRTVNTVSLRLLRSPDRRNRTDSVILPANVIMTHVMTICIV